MMNDVLKNAEQRMKKTVEALHLELGKIRTGRANPALLDGVMVSYYGQDTPLARVASVAVTDARTLTVTPFEKSLVQAIEKAIRASDLGLNPAASGTTLRVPLPPLTEERRKDMVKLVRAAGENARVSVRNTRRDANGELKELLKEKIIGEDEERRGQDSIQKLTDKYIAEVEKTLEIKEKDLMEV